MNYNDCPHCDSHRNEGSSFCGNCGNPLDCPHCDDYRSQGAVFCGNCGRRLRDDVLYTPRKDRRLPPVFMIGLFAALVATFFIIVAATALYLYSVDIFRYLADYTYYLLILVPAPYPLVIFSGAWTQLYWVFLLVMLTASFAWLVYELYTKHIESRRKGEGLHGIEKTSIYWIGLLWPSTIFLQLAIMYLVILGTGVEISTPELGISMYEAMFVLASAGVWEEIITRVLLIGVPLAVAASVTGKARSWRYLLGGFGVSKLSMVFIIIAAAVFGYAHNDGWGISKVIPSFIFGMAAGFLYAKYGLHAAILLHFVNDYLMAFLWLGGSEVTLGLLTLLLIGLGIVTTIMIAMKSIPFVKNFKDRPVFPDSFASDKDD